MGTMRKAMLAGALVLPLIGAAPASAACAGADDTVVAAKVGQARGALRCLINAQRADAGLAPLKKSPTLARIAKSYAKQMRDQDFFGHASPQGETRPERFKAAGYDHKGAENLGFTAPAPAGCRG